MPNSATNLITVDMIMSIDPCVRWPRSAVEAALARADRSSWEALVESARADEWRACSRYDMRWMMSQYAARYHRTNVLTPWVVAATHLRVAAQRKRWPSASPATVAIWDRLERWRGDRAEILEIKSDAAAHAYDDYAAAHAADAADAACAEKVTAYAEESMLLDLARRLDALSIADSGSLNVDAVQQCARFTR
jgi:hypothetical protein